jgi:hypothetical protein
MSDTQLVSAVVHTPCSSRFYDDYLKRVGCQPLHAQIIIVDAVSFLKRPGSSNRSRSQAPFFVAVSALQLTVLRMSDCQLRALLTT